MDLRSATFNTSLQRRWSTPCSKGYSFARLLRSGAPRNITCIRCTRNSHRLPSLVDGLTVAWISNICQLRSALSSLSRFPCRQKKQRNRFARNVTAINFARPWRVSCRLCSRSNDRQRWARVLVVYPWVSVSSSLLRISVAVESYPWKLITKCWILCKIPRLPKGGSKHFEFDTYESQRV